MVQYKKLFYYTYMKGEHSMDIKIKVRKELIKDPNMREAVKNIEQMHYLENNDKMFEMLNAFSYDTSFL